jgi:hypothetical protein
MDIMAVSSSAAQYSNINCITYSVCDEKFRIVGILGNSEEERPCCEVLFPHQLSLLL